MGAARQPSDRTTWPRPGATAGSGAGGTASARHHDSVGPRRPMTGSYGVLKLLTRSRFIKLWPPAKAALNFS